MELLIKEPSDGFMVPIPQYPLYSATLALYGGRCAAPAPAAPKAPPPPLWRCRCRQPLCCWQAAATLAARPAGLAPAHRLRTPAPAGTDTSLPRLSATPRRLVPYELDESRGWGLDVAHLAEQLAKARAEGTNVRGVVVINPGNPTGQCLSRANMEAVATFCR